MWLFIVGAWPFFSGRVLRIVVNQPKLAEQDTVAKNHEQQTFGGDYFTGHYLIIHSTLGQICPNHRTYVRNVSSFFFWNSLSHF